MLKIAYISPIYFSDVDISYLMELRKRAEVYYFLPIGPLTKAAAVNIDQIYPHNGIFPASIYPELQQMSQLLDMDRTYIINRYASHSIHFIQLYREVSRLFDQLHIDIVHATEPFFYFEFPLYKWRHKTILSVHDPFLHSCIHSKRWELRRKIAFRLLDHLVLFNENQKEFFVQTYHHPGLHVYNSHLSAYNYLTYHPTSTSPISNPYILFFGQITPHKGIDTLLEAMTLVHRQNTNIHLIIAGKGAFPMDLTPYQGLEYIHIHNRFIPEQELTTMIAHCEFVVCPYKDATQSGVVMSAFAFSKPVLASNVGGLPEMIQDGELGCLVEPSNPCMLAEKILYMLSDQCDLAKMSSNINKKYMQGDLSWSHIAQTMVSDVYSNI